MADIQFEEENLPYAQPSLAEDKPWSIRMLLRTGIIAGEEQAKYILLGIAILLTVIALAIPFFSGTSYRVPQNIVNAALKLPDVPVQPPSSSVPGMPVYGPAPAPNPYYR